MFLDNKHSVTYLESRVKLSYNVLVKRTCSETNYFGNGKFFLFRGLAK